MMSRLMADLRFWPGFSDTDVAVGREAQPNGQIERGAVEQDRRVEQAPGLDGHGGATAARMGGHSLSAEPITEPALPHPEL